MYFLLLLTKSVGVNVILGGGGGVKPPQPPTNRALSLSETRRREIGFLFKFRSNLVVP